MTKPMLARARVQQFFDGREGKTSVSDKESTDEGVTRCGYDSGTTVQKSELVVAVLKCLSYTTIH